MPFWSARYIGAVIGGILTDRFGRRRLIILAGIIFTASAIASALAPTVTWLIVDRVASGLAIGIASFISPMYIAELVPAKVRGSLVAVNMLAITTGIVVAYLADYALSGIQGWRYMFGLAAIPSIILTVAMWKLPDSPRWLIGRSRVEQARRVLQLARIQSDVSAEITDIQNSMEEQGAGGMTGLFEPSLRMPLIVGAGLAIFQQITGINTVIYYAPTIFKFAGITAAGPAILAGAALAMVMWCLHVLAIFMLDRVGRRPLTIYRSCRPDYWPGDPGRCLSISAVREFEEQHSHWRPGDLCRLFRFRTRPIFWLLISEIYPLKVRGAAMSAVTVINWAMNLAVAVTFLTLVAVLGQAETFWLYGVIALGAWVFIYFLVPETKGKSLEQIEAHWRTGKAPRKL